MKGLDQVPRTTSVFREMKNPLIIIEQIFRRTGIHVEVLSNAEQHFLGYKSIAAIENGFKKMIQKGNRYSDGAVETRDFLV